MNRVWVVVSEHNVDEWPNAGLQPHSRPVFAQIKAKFLDLAGQGRSPRVKCQS